MTDEVRPLTTDMEPEPTTPAEPASGGLFGLFMSRRGRLERRLLALTAQIDAHPDGPANYVLRGELYLKAGEAALAAADFRQALALTQALLETANWGFIAQALEDRARTGLERAARRLAAPASAPEDTTHG